MPEVEPSFVTDSKQTIRGLLNWSVVSTPAKSSSTTSNIEQTSGEKIEALTEMICRAGEEPSAALFVLMATLENSTDPKALSNLAKHLAFTRCGEFNVYGIVDAQITAIESELFASHIT